jgi:hypothetical protein
MINQIGDYRADILFKTASKRPVFGQPVGFIWNPGLALEIPSRENVILKYNLGGT